MTEPPEWITVEEMKRTMPELTAKMELIVMRGDDGYPSGIYQRDVNEDGEKGFRRLESEPRT